MLGSSSTLVSLRRYNLVAGCLHLAQALAIVLLANGFSLPVRAAYMTGAPSRTVGHQTVVLFNLSFAWAIAAFFFLSALAHFGVAGPRWQSYQAQLLGGRNPYRWLEYSLSASIMIVLIAMLVGIDDIAALVALVGVNASMIGFGWMQERYEAPGAGLGPFWTGCIAGIVPWAAIAVYLIGPGARAHAPGFVYGIFFSLFVLVQLLRRQPVAPVQAGWQVEGLPPRRKGLRHLVPRRQEPARLADLRLDAGLQRRALTSSADYQFGVCQRRGPAGILAPHVARHAPCARYLSAPAIRPRTMCRCTSMKSPTGRTEKISPAVIASYPAPMSSAIPSPAVYRPRFVMKADANR